MNLFDDDDRRFYVLKNAGGQYSIWPAGIAVPIGWTIVGSEMDRRASLAFIDEHWTDMRPNNSAARS
jgi:uncharacterized protein YbdZ (MbtH family)